MGRKIAVTLVLVCASSILGATVFREPIAYAAAKLTPVVVTNDAANPVPVDQQGTSDVHVTNSSLSVQQQGTADVRVTNASVPVQQQGTADVRITNGSLATLRPSPLSRPAGTASEAARGAPSASSTTPRRRSR